MEALLLPKQDLHDVLSGIMQEESRKLLDSFKELIGTRPEPVTLLTRNEAAKKIGCSLGTLRNYELKGTLCPKRIGRKVRYLSTDIQQAFQKQARK